LGKESIVWKNKEILTKNGKDIYGYVQIQMRFKKSIALNVALVRNNLEDLSLLIEN